MNIYLATPVNGRKEKTLLGKMKAARERILEMQLFLRSYFPGDNFWSSYDISAVFLFVIEQNNMLMMNEAGIMGECVRMVMECDMIVLDDGWECSQGCTVERFVAMQYGKQVKTINSFKLTEQLKK